MKNVACGHSIYDAFLVDRDHVDVYVSNLVEFHFPRSSIDIVIS